MCTYHTNHSVGCIKERINLERIENKRRLQTLSMDNAWSNKNFRMLQHTSSEVNGYNSACKESRVRQPGASGFCDRASEFCA